jgi:hypothetical protein
MSKREVSVIIKAKNALASGLASAGASLKSFGQSAMRIGAAFAKSFLVAGTALVGFGIKAVQAFSVQEKAEKEAAAALRAWGDEVDGNMVKIKAFTAAIQDETGIGDENTMARAAKLRLLGVEAEQLEAATKATIALGAAGMDEQAAIKAVAMAMDGEFTMLQRYLPALRSASSEAEKATIVNDFLTKGYSAQKEQLDTVSGRWGELKGRIGDAMEEIGGAIVKSSAMNGVLASLSERVKVAGQSIASWTAGGGVERMIDTFKLFALNVRETFEQIGAYAKFGIENAWESVKWFGEAAVTVFKNAGSIIKTTWENTTDQAGYYLAKLHAKITKQEWNLEPPPMKDIFSGIEAIPEKVGDASENLDKRLAQIAKERQAREAAMVKKEQAKVEEKAQAVEAAANAEVKAQEKVDVARVNPLKAIEEEIKLAKEKMRIHGEMAKKTISEILAESKARKDAAKEWDKDVKKATELRGRLGRGTKLSKQDAEWLDAFEQIEAARKGLGAAKGQIENAQKQLDAINKQNAELGNIKDELTNIHRDLTNLLQRG